MIPVSYLIAVTSSQPGVEVTLAVFNLAGRAHPVCGFSNDIASTDLWVIPKGKGSRQEVIEQLQAVPAIRNVSVVALSNPVGETELKEVRQLFAGIGWDASSVPDDALSVFLNAKLKGQHTFYIDYNPRERAPVRIQIKLLEQHPHFSPHWLQTAAHSGDEEPEGELTLDDIEIRSIVIKEEVKAPPPPPNSKQ